LLRAISPRPYRQGAINASTVFAITLAIVAGLIFAMVAKAFVFDRKQVKVQEPEKVKLTVAAVNILDKQEVLPQHIKTITLNKDEYDRLLASERFKGRTLLKGNQPVSRTTKEPINAEEPLFAEQFYPLSYPESVDKRLGPGKQSIIVEVPAKDTMVQVDDVVDVLCTLSNDNPVFGPAGSSATAVLAKGLRVVARFNTTRIAAQPPPGPNRTFTLEVDPWQGAVIELAKQVKGAFSLTVSRQGESEGGEMLAIGPAGVDVPKNPYQIVAANFNQTKRVTMADLALLFGVEPAPPEKVFRLEQYVGNRQGPTREYRNLDVPATEETLPAPMKNGVKPAVGPARNSPRPTTLRDGAFNSSTSMAAREAVHSNFGFKPVGGDPNECKTCEKKK
jgi:Flp pilus assembly protein CpaB